MRLLEFDYLEPESLEDAAIKMGEFNGNCQVIAGGTDLLIALKQRLTAPSGLVSLDKIPSLRDIKEKNGVIVIGAMCTLEDILCSELIAKKLPALKQAAWSRFPLCAPHDWRKCLFKHEMPFLNQSSFWRSAWKHVLRPEAVFAITNKQESCVSTFSADIPPALIAYGANIRLVGPGGERTLPLDQFYTADGRFPHKILAGSREILTEIEVPVPTAQVGSTYHKYRLRESIDFPLLGVAVMLKLHDGKFCEDARLVITGAESAPVEAVRAREELLHHELEPDLLATVAKTAASEIHPIKTSLVSPRYKREVAKIIVTEALKKAGGI